MDLSKFSDEDLAALKSRDLTKMSDAGLQLLKGQTAPVTGEQYQTSGQMAVGAAKRVLDPLAKLGGSLRALSMGPATGLLLEATSKKPAFTDAEGKPSFSPLHNMGEALNPTDIFSGDSKKFPSNREMFARTGTPNPELSDVVPGYAQPGAKHPWYQPEKGGWLDPSAAGIAEVVSDPAMYLGMGEIGAGAKIMRGARPITGAMDAIPTAVKIAGSGGGKAVAMGAEPLWNGTVGRIPYTPSLNTVVNPLSAATRAFGKATYGSTMLPVEHEGETYGKTAVADTMRNAGVWRSGVMQDKLTKAADALEGERGRIFSETPGIIDMPEALAPGYAEVRRLRSLGSLNADRIADELEKQLNHTVQVSKGIPPTPAIPAQYATQEIPSALLDMEGKPIMKTKVVQTSPEIPGDPGIPAQPYDAQRATNLKSFMTNTMPNSTFNETLSTPEGIKGMAKAAGGLKGAIENVVEDTHPTVSGADVEDINKNLGNILGTPKGQVRVTREGDRNFAKFIKGTGLDIHTNSAVGGVTGDPSAIAKSILLNKLGRLWQMGAMPWGYGVQSFGNTNLLDRWNQLKQEGANPWRQKE